MESFDERSPLAPEERRAAPRRLMDSVRSNRRLLLVLACLAVFLLLLRSVLAGEAMRIDALAYWAIVESLRADWLTPVMEAFSALATPMVLVGMLLVIAAFAPGRRPGWFCTVNLVLAVLLNLLLKEIVQRPRPEGFRLAAETGFSFPSGHSMAAMAFFGLIGGVLLHHPHDRREPRLPGGALCVRRHRRLLRLPHLAGGVHAPGRAGFLGGAQAGRFAIQ